MLFRFGSLSKVLSIFSFYGINLTKIQSLPIIGRKWDCPDCTYVKQQVEGKEGYEVIDIGAHVRNLKEFLKLRDHSEAFKGAKKVGAAGIPCFVLEDGTVTLVPEDAGLQSRPIAAGTACNLDGSGC